MASSRATTSPEAPTGKWEVHSWHITVPVGEAAIHLLVFNPDKFRQRAVVHRAILIDGGKPKELAVKRIEEIIAIIEGKYAFAESFQDFYPAETGTPQPSPSGGGSAQTKKTHSLRFDSIVITHWDSDHFEGVLGLLESGFERSYNAWKASKVISTATSPSSTDPPVKKWAAFLQGEPTKKVDLAYLPCWYCKYGDAVGPRTHFNAP